MPELNRAAKDRACTEGHNEQCERQESDHAIPLEDLSRANVELSAAAANRVTPAQPVAAIRLNE